MWNWLARRKSELPCYSLLKAEPCRGLPRDLEEQENSDAYGANRDRIEADLLSQATADDLPGFATTLKAGNGLLTFLAPELPGGCLLIFSSGLRAADYARVQVPKKKLEYFCSTPAQIVSGVAQLREQGVISHFALDRCPRCNIFTTFAASALDTPGNAIRIWKIFKATEIARCNLYLEYARTAADAGELLTARNVALELVGHVTLEDQRPHLLLGTLAVHLRDKRLSREAGAFLTFLQQGAGAR